MATIRARLFNLMKKIILIVIGIIIIALLGRLGWAYFQVKSDEAKVVNTPALVVTPTPEPVMVSIATTTLVEAAPIVVKTLNPVVSQVKFEIDKYGVDLYKLKQATTSVQKIINGENVEIRYVRGKNLIERKVSIIHTNRGKEVLTNTIDLDAKQNLPTMIKTLEAQVVTDCKNASSKDCTEGKIVLDALRTTCVTLQKNEEISMCIVAAIFGAAMGGTSGGWSFGQ